MYWKGFVVESKSYMSYERMGKRERVRFWLRFPISWLRFQWCGLTMRAVDVAYAAKNFVARLFTPRN